MEWAARQSREFDEKHPILDTRYYVEEYDKREGWYIDDDRTPAPSVLVRKFGPMTKAELDEWLDKHEPDDGHHFLPRHENLRHYCYDKWGK